MGADKLSSPSSDDGDRLAAVASAAAKPLPHSGHTNAADRDRYQIGSFASLPPPRVAPTLPGPNGGDEDDDPAAHDTRGLASLEQSYANLYARRAALEAAVQRDTNLIVQHKKLYHAAVAARQEALGRRELEVNNNGELPKDDLVSFGATPH